MANSWDFQAAKKANADAPRDLGHEVGEEADSAEDRQIDELADEMVGRGVGRRDAMKCACAAVAVLKAKDRRVCGGLGVAYAGNVDGAVNAAAGGLGWMLQPDASDKLIEALSRAWEAKDATLALGCMFFAMGKPPLGVYSFRALAQRRGVSPQAVKNGVEDFQQILGLPRNTLQKSDAAVEKYKQTNGAL